MKKIAALLLAVTMCLCLTACFGETTVNVDCDHEEYEPLIDMIEDGDFEEAHAFLYELEGLDPEMPEEEWTVEEEQVAVAPEVFEEPQEEAAKPDTSGLLSFVEIITTDNLGNQNSSTEEFWTYDGDGRILETDSVELQEYYGYEFGTFVPHFVMEYGENDVVTKITVMHHDDIEALITPEYDENGNLLHCHIVTNTGEYDVNFTYDAAGNRLTGERFDSWYNTIEYFTYTYDEEGKLIQKVHDAETPWYYVTTIDYTYDEAGVLVETTENWKQNGFGNNSWHVYNQYNYDENGKLLVIVVTTDEEGSSYSQKEIVYNYD